MDMLLNVERVSLRNALRGNVLICPLEDYSLSPMMCNRHFPSYCRIPNSTPTCDGSGSNFHGCLYP